MLRTSLTHPQILQALASAGHGSTVLIADGFYPFRTASGPNAATVYLNLAPGLPSVDQVLEALLPVLPLEAAATMRDGDDHIAEPHHGYQQLIGDAISVGSAARFEFYAQARTENLALVIATGDQRPCANLLLTVGVR